MEVEVTFEESAKSNESNEVVESKEEEKLLQTEKVSEGGHFDVIPQYSEKATVSNLGSAVAGGGAASVVAGPPAAMMLLLMLSVSLGLG